MNPYRAAGVFSMAQLISYEEGSKGHTQNPWSTKYTWYTDPQHTVGDAHPTSPVHTMGRSTIQMTRAHAKTKITVMRSFKNCARGSQICKGPTRTHCVIAAQVVYEDLPTAHPYGKRGDRRGAWVIAHLEMKHSKA